MNELTGKVAVVVGASRGIGAATAIALASMGAKLCLAAPPSENCESVIEQIHGVQGEARAFCCDAADAKQVAAVVAEAVAAYGRVDILINCAGIMQPVALVENCPGDLWARCVMVNLVGAFNGCQAVLPHFRRAGHGVIVNMSTAAAFHGLEGWSAYCSSKAGLVMLSRIVAAEVQGTGIKVYSFQPGMVNTDLGRESMKVKINSVTNLDPNTFAPPTEPAQAIAWLCAAEPTDLVGQEVVITDPEFRQRCGL